jgi:caffeoyl-CoA O-methyltransferase
MSRITDTPGLTDYLTGLAGQDETLARVNRETGELPQGMMQSRPDQGALLTFLARLVEARVAIEVGTFTGYGAICIARGLAEGGRLTCFEVDAHWAEIASANLEAAGVADRATVEVGPAAASLARLPEEPHVDFVYVDADKTGYPGYYDALVPRLRPGGLLVLDNTLLSGRVIDPHDDTARVMAALNERVAADERVDSVLLGLADGMTLVRRRAT